MLVSGIQNLSFHRMCIQNKRVIINDKNIISLEFRIQDDAETYKVICLNDHYTQLITVNTSV